MIIGGIQPDHFHLKTFIKTASYIQDDLTWCVQRANAVPRWMNVFFIPKDFLIYIIGAIAFIFVILGAYLLTTFEDRAYDFILISFMSIQVVLGLATVLDPKKWMFRLLFTKFMFIAFWIVQIFNAYWMTYVSRVLYEKQIDTIDELIHENFHLAGDKYVLNQLKSGDMVSA